MVVILKLLSSIVLRIGVCDAIPEQPILIATRVSHRIVLVKSINIQGKRVSTRAMFQMDMAPKEQIGQVSGWEGSVFVTIVGYKGKSENYEGYIRACLFAKSSSGVWQHFDLGVIEPSTNLIWASPSTLLELGPRQSERVRSIGGISLESHRAMPYEEEAAFLPGWSMRQSKAEKFIRSSNLLLPTRFHQIVSFELSGFWPPSSGRVATISSDGQYLVVNHGGNDKNVTTLFWGPDYCCSVDLLCPEPASFRFGVGVLAIETYLPGNRSLCTVYDLKDGKVLARIPCGAIG